MKCLCPRSRQCSRIRRCSLQRRDAASPSEHAAEGKIETPHALIARSYHPHGNPTVAGLRHLALVDLGKIRRRSKQATRGGQKFARRVLLGNTERITTTAVEDGHPRSERFTRLGD